MHKKTKVDTKNEETYKKVEDEVKNALPKISEAIVLKAKKLTVQVKDGGKTEKGMIIELNAAGYLNSLRKAFDGITYFGTDETNLLSVIFIQ